MSITVKDCLHLPSLSFGKVIGGKAGLEKIVSSVSVLEVFEHLELNVFTPNELIISALCGVKDDVEKQCEVLKDLSNTGGIALVLFYVGRVIPTVDEKLIRLADKLELPLIEIKSDDYRIKYSDIISDVMSSIIQDQTVSDDFISTTEKRLAQLPTELRSMENLLDIMSNHFKCSLVLTGTAQLYFQSVYHPALTLTDPELFYDQFHDEPAGYSHKEVLSEDTHFHLYKMDFSHLENTRMTLYASCCNTVLDEKTLSDMCTCTRFYSTVWGYSLNPAYPQTLLSLIFKADEKAALRFLQTTDIGFDRLRNLIIISPGDGDIDVLMTQITRIFDEYHKYFLADIIDHQIVILSNLYLPDSFDNALFDELWQFVNRYDAKASFFMDGGSKDIPALKRTYSDYRKSVPALRKIFLNRRNWDTHDIMLSQEVMALSETHSRRTEHLYDIINTLKNDSDDLLSTLCIYLIDCDSKLNQTAQTLFLHRNTVSYRLNKVKQLTNTNFTLMPAAYDFYTALALWRYSEI